MARRWSDLSQSEKGKEDTVGTKKRYESPVLQAYGDIRALTGVKVGVNSDPAWLFAQKRGGGVPGGGDDGGGLCG